MNVSVTAVKNFVKDMTYFPNVLLSFRSIAIEIINNALLLAMSCENIFIIEHERLCSDVLLNGWPGFYSRQV
jgi:hypothetical protein